MTTYEHHKAAREIEAERERLAKEMAEQHQEEDEESDEESFEEEVEDEVKSVDYCIVKLFYILNINFCCQSSIGFESIC